MSKLAVICFASLVTLSMTNAAHAKGAICERVQNDMFSVDGMMDDWEAFKNTRFGSGSDAQLDVRCAYDQEKLYIAVQAADDRVVRGKKDDKISFSLRSGTGRALSFSVLPGTKRSARKVVGLPRYVQLEDSLQSRGFSVELAIPLRKISGWSATLPYLRASILFHDSDGPGKTRRVGMSRGKLHFSDAASTYKQFMKTTGLKNRDIRLDKLVDIDPGAGAERLIIGGKVMGVLGTSFSYMGLPIASPKDLLRARVVRFDGSGRHAVLTELRQHGNGGSRDVVIIWFANGNGGFDAALTVETRKQRGDAFIANTWSLVPRGKHREGKKKRRMRGVDLLVRVGEGEGFTESNFREAPAPDAKSILTPWGEQQSALYYLEGSVAYGGDTAANLPQ